MDRPARSFRAVSPLRVSFHFIPPLGGGGVFFGGEEEGEGAAQAAAPREPFRRTSRRAGRWRRPDAPFLTPPKVTFFHPSYGSMKLKGPA